MKNNNIKNKYIRKKMINFENITFRKSNNTPEDFALLRNIHKLAIQKSVIETIGQWDEEFQKSRLEHHFKESYNSLEFIILNNQVIGTINCRKKFFDDKPCHFVEQFYLLPEYQNKGLGSYLLQNKLSLEIENRLSVLKNDINTHNFYYKNGFVEYAEDQYQKYMKKIPRHTHKVNVKIK